MNNDIAGTAGLEDCGDSSAVAACKDFQLGDDLFCIGVADAEDFVAARVQNLLAQLGLRFCCEKFIHDGEAL
jgi:hypothetical protein